MSQSNEKVTPKTAVDPEEVAVATVVADEVVPEESLEKPSAWTKHCGPETLAFNVRVRIQEVRATRIHQTDGCS